MGTPSENLGTGVLVVDLDINDITAKLNELSKRMQSILNSASRKSAQKMVQNLSVLPQRTAPIWTMMARDFQSTMIAAARFAARVMAATLREIVEEVSPLSIEIEAETLNARHEIQRLANETVTVNVHGDTTHLAASILLAEKEAQKSSARLSAAFGAAGSALGGLAGVAKTALSLGALGIAGAQAAQGIFQVTAALAPMAGILAAGPAVILGFQAALGALKLALSGVGEAFGAALTGDSKAFEKSLEGLSPKAQAAAREVRALKPAFTDLKNSVQDAFFNQITGEITATAKALQGPLKSGLTAISRQWGEAAAGVTGYLQGSRGVANVSSILGGAEKAVAGLSDTTNKLTAGFLQVAAVVSDAFGDQLQSGIAGLGQKFGGFLQNIASSGKAVAWVDGALTAFAQLGDILGNVGAILKAVFSAANEVGLGTLGTVQVVTDALRDLATSAEGNKALVGFFTALSSVASQLGPILVAIVKQIGAIAPALVPLFETLGPTIVSVITAIGTAVQALLPGVLAFVTTLADGVKFIAESGVLTQLATSFSLIFTALTPLLPVIAQLVVTIGQSLNPVLSGFAPVIGAAAAAVGSLITAALPLIEVAGQLASQIGPILTPIVATLSDIFEQFAPVVANAAQLLSDLLAPILNALPGLLNPILQLVGTLTSALFPLLIRLLDGLRPAFEKVSEALVRLAEKLTPVLEKLGDLAGRVLTKLLPLLEPLIELVAKLAGVFADQLARTIDNVVIPALDALVALMNGDVEGATKNVEKALLNVGKEIVKFFITLPGQIVGAIGNTGKVLFSAGEDLIFGLMNGIRNVAGRLVDVAKNVVGDAVGAAKNLLGISSPSKVFHEIGVFTGQGLVNGLHSMAGKVGQEAARMAGTVANPFGTVPLPGAGGGLSQAQTGFPGPGSNSAQFTSARDLAAPRTVINNFVIHEVGGGDATAQRVINRLVMAGGGL